MPATANAVCTAVSCVAMLVSGATHAEGIDTERIFGFMIGSDVGEHEFQSETTGRFGKGGGHYHGGEQELELELVPAKNFRIELGTAFVGNDIGGLPGFDDRPQLAWQGASLDLRYRFLDRETAPFGMALSVQNEASRIDDSSGAPTRRYGTAFTLAFDREIVPDRVVTALNLSY
ncbi:MAG: hypothetical protein WA702_04140 [Bradyrhizobium sp.]|uniref:hypothetical protein n=1 Tax=Bradyrhizobium sp. TaxID=376 RepID=UPI003C7AAE32